MRCFFILISSIWLIGCSSTKDKIYYKHDPKWDIADDAYDNEIGKKVFVQLKKEKNLKVCESGFGLRGSDKIRCMHCGFDYFAAITLEEARGLLLHVANLYLRSINGNERIRPFLEHYPFGPDNIEIRIFLFNADGSLPSPDKLQTISIIEGKLRYKIGEEDLKRMRKVICEETYEEALAKLKQDESIDTTLKDPIKL